MGTSWVEVWAPGHQRLVIVVEAGVAAAAAAFHLGADVRAEGGGERLSARVSHRIVRVQRLHRRDAHLVCGAVEAAVCKGGAYHPARGRAILGAIAGRIERLVVVTLEPG